MDQLVCLGLVQTQRRFSHVQAESYGQAYSDTGGCDKTWSAGAWFVYREDILVKAVFDASMKWHLIEEFGPESFRVQDDGTLLFEHEYIDKDIVW